MKASLLFLLTLISVSVIGQNETETDTLESGHVTASIRDTYGVKVGLSGGKHLFGEVGLYYEQMHEFGGLPLANAPSFNLGAEFGYIGKPILAPKIGTRVHATILQIGLSFLWYSDLNGGYAPTFRPEIGIGIFHEIELVYAYNWDLVNENMGMINTHMVTLRVNLDFMQVYTHEHDTGAGWREL
ncbi:hypothetical protein [Phaeocystidibacter luteus]|uniref:Outer membrane protein beta-barrel domain-containing protein n=1 Tax=Phaeocystidibacter luteus TaxID=911197 RepID=A0A6N6RF89_9FLAO|nr:hypothetical protein [Phaeocystidibacter luteus]KAB2805407.1 hypothetical protein F8C67_13820 [Phaeocystidibacter luteus]